MARKILTVCVLLACAAPVTAKIYMINEGAGSGGWSDTNFNGSVVTYNPTPDQTAVDKFWADYAPVFNTPPAAPLALHFAEPWYSFANVNGTGERPGPDDEVRSTWGGGSIRFKGTSTIGTLRLGDAYWPNQISGGVAYQFGGINRTEGPYNLTIGTVYHGRNPDEVLDNHDPGMAQWKSTAAPLAIPTLMAVRYHGDAVDNKLNIGEIKMLRNATLRGSLPNNEPSMLCISTRSHGVTNPVNLQINIGNIFLNEELLYLELTGGTTTISGNIGLMEGAEAGNLVTLITGVKAAMGAPLNPSAVLNLSWTELYEMIDAGQLYSYPVTGLGGARTYMHNYVTAGGEQGFYNRLASGAITRITRENMYTELYIKTLDNGMATVRMIPEPASLLLLSLGGLALTRRRRA
jgi:hypothetical protein